MMNMLKAFIRWNWQPDKSGHLRADNQPRPQQAAKSITHAVQRGSWVTVYSGNNSLFTRSGELTGYTGSSVSVRHGNWITTYDVRGNSIGTVAAR
jgi:hypothetical protein